MLTLFTNMHNSTISGLFTILKPNFKAQIEISVSKLNLIRI